MFTGIIEEIGIVEAHDRGVLKVRCSRVLEGTDVGHSVAVNGVCLTVIDITDAGFRADVSAETAARSTLGRLGCGTPVNLERAARFGQPVGGHLVQGHVDATGRVMELGGGRLRVGAERAVVLDYCVVKCSIALDGVSLTISGLDDTSFYVELISYTVENTNLGKARRGGEVNIEVDLIGKYVKKFLNAGSENINEAFLAEHGYI